jgi:hypothetical protein|tara:strand:- start:857 stop:1015 length:159 start_codon:yes stop_codon:yes gene_type:complete
MKQSAPILSEEEKSAVEGLMILGRTRDQAIKEVRQNDEDQQAQMERDWWNKS